MDANDPLPPASRLLHVGLPKTGTTAIQGALDQARRAMRASGVVYPGNAHQHRAAARAVTRAWPKGDAPPDPQTWNVLVRHVSRAGGNRVVISAEAFTNADEPTAREIVSAVGGQLVHVVVTVRPLVRLLPSVWQQTVVGGVRETYGDWLARVLDERRANAANTGFWRQPTRPDITVDRWRSVVGPRNLTVVAVDETDTTMLLRTFEQMLALPAGLLETPRATNPSLTFGEVELLRRLNRELHTRGWSSRRRRALVLAVRNHLQRSRPPGLDGQRIRTPTWAVERAGELGRAAADRIGSSGVRIVGDITTLGSIEKSDTPSPPLAELPSETAAAAVVGAIRAAERKAPVLTQ